ncbi:MAG: penicillin acylase family protein, partial [Myxococcales bacterium]|nr:penicillin acylase family protein [Myxococcales bacterium]
MTRLKLFGSLLLGGAVGAFASLGGCVDEGGGSTTGTPPGTGGGGTGGGGAGGMGGGTTGITIDGLSDVVDAKYDDDGLLHLSCATNEDCYAALGYFHAQNRFFFMDFVRNLVRGKLA